MTKIRIFRIFPNHSSGNAGICETRELSDTGKPSKSRERIWCYINIPGVLDVLGKVSRIATSEGSFGELEIVMRVLATP